MASEITDLLIRWSDGDPAALETLAPLVEAELHRLAHSYMRKERPGHILKTTALINEAYLKLLRQNRVHWQNRAHFFGIAGQMMRRTLKNYARDEGRIKRGGGALRVSLFDNALVSHPKLEEVLAVDEALEGLAAIDRQLCLLVEMRYFFGMSVEETAEVLGVSTSKVNRDWKIAKAWLARAVGGEAGGDA